MITIITLISTIVMMMCGNPNHDNINVYALSMAVVEVDEKCNVVTCVDTSGNEWAFDDVADWHRGDLVSAIMSDMGTLQIYDDEIISVKYDGIIHDTFGWDYEYNLPIVDFSEER